jgi:hypothetical protein
MKDTISNVANVFAPSHSVAGVAGTIWTTTAMDWIAGKRWDDVSSSQGSSEICGIVCNSRSPI